MEAGSPTRRGWTGPEKVEQGPERRAMGAAFGSHSGGWGGRRRELENHGQVGRQECRQFGAGVGA